MRRKVDVYVRVVEGVVENVVDETQYIASHRRLWRCCCDP
jgi:hypothetical protein